MNKIGKINVYSEIENLKTVLLHRPGNEIENLIPEYLGRLLFDDIPYLKVARIEHDNFAKILENNGAKVLYLEELVAEAIKEAGVKDIFLKDILKEGLTASDNSNSELTDELIKYLKTFNEKAMIDILMSGIRKKDIGMKEELEEDPFLMDPMPNLYFTRDPFAAIGCGISLNSMNTRTRKRETIFSKYIFKYHPEFIVNPIPHWYNRNEHSSLEGGDELILSKEVIAIGHSQRTSEEAIKRISKNIFLGKDEFNTILLFQIPKRRAYMHLDTVFTMIDYDKFTIHNSIEKELKVIAITFDKKNNDIIMKEEVDSLQGILVKYLKRDIKLINCGGGDRIISAREQWNDGSNSLAIAPGKVITYERNYVTNEILSKNNVEVIAIPSSELSRGRGGPRCMSMPLYREL
ncbi:MAG TPA: arginine deiminase [Clostridiaceae bacterium]